MNSSSLSAVQTLDQAVLMRLLCNTLVTRNASGTRWQLNCAPATCASASRCVCRPPSQTTWSSQRAVLGLCALRWPRSLSGASRVRQQIRSGYARRNWPRPLRAELRVWQQIAAHSAASLPWQPADPAELCAAVRLRAVSEQARMTVQVAWRAFGGPGTGGGLGLELRRCEETSKSAPSELGKHINTHTSSPTNSSMRGFRGEGCSEETVEWASVSQAFCRLVGDALLRCW